jgi:hypothetical protein
VNRDLTVPSTGEKLPVEIFDAGDLRYGSWDPGDEDADSRALWRRAGAELIVRLPWALLGFADPSAHQVAVPRRSGAGVATRTTRTGPGVGVTVSASGTDQVVGDVTWVNWNRPYYTTRLKQGAERFRDAALEVTRSS